MTLNRAQEMPFMFASLIDPASVRERERARNIFIVLNLLISLTHTLSPLWNILEFFLFLLSSLFEKKKGFQSNISFIACATQYFVGCWMGQAECCLLAAMAYDRYVAIGRPLQYSAVMAPGLCQKMVAGACGSGFLSSLAETIPCFHLYYCGPNIIPNFFCDITHIISLSCSNPFMSQMILFLESIFVGFTSFLVILLSYGFIATSILKISSIKGSAKAFNTCASHLVVVTIFYSTSLFMYLHPNSSHSKKQNKVLSVFCFIFIPMLNLLINNLRNKEVKEALREC